MSTNEPPVGNGEPGPAEAVAPNQQADSATDAALQMTNLEYELQQAKDRELRAHAELENFRKRMRRDMEEERRYAALPLVRDLLPVVDNLERAVQAADAAHQTSSLLDGVRMVVQQLVTAFEKHHVKRIEAIGDAFNPHLHEAIAQEPSQDYPAGMVTRVAQMGYQLHDRVIRPSQVLVSKGS